MNASAGDFLTQVSPGVRSRRTEAITQLPSGELRAGAVKARRPRADTRVVGAKRRALHSVEHSSKLDCVMAAHAEEPETARDQKADRETGFPGRSAQPIAQRDDVWAARTTTTGMDERRSQTTVGRLGRERPSPHCPGAKSAGENPGSLTPQCPH